MKTTSKLWAGLAILIVLTPIGLILPEHFKSGSAWGEWGSDAIKKLAGYLPRGYAKLSPLWNAPLPDYALKGSEEKSLCILSLSYILSAIIGVAVVALAAWFIARALAKKGD